MKKIVKVVGTALVATMLLASCGTTSKVDSTEKKEKTSTDKKSEKTATKKSSSNKKNKGFDQDAFDEAYAKGDYDSCIEMLGLRKSDVVLTDFDESMLTFLNKNYVGSAKSFLAAQDDMKQVSNGMTAGKAMEAAIAGENSITYYGPTYERLLTYSMNVVNALKENDVDNAVGTFSNYTGTYAAEIAQLVQMEKEIAKSSEGKLSSEEFNNALNVISTQAGLVINMNSVANEKPKKSSKVYEESPFLFYLGALTYAANGDADHAADMTKHLRDSGVKVDVSKNLNVVVLTDVIARKEEERKDISFGNIGKLNFGIKPVYQVVKEHDASVIVTKVSVSDGQTSGAVLIEDFDNAARIDAENRAYGAYCRSIFRSIVKKAPVLAAGVAAIASAEESVKNASNPLQVKAANVALNKATDSLAEKINSIDNLEKADLRQGLFFPSKASAANFNVKPGKYTVTVEYSNGKRDVIENVVVSAGKPTIVVSECLNSGKVKTTK